jgi:hypothetical protein
MFLKYCVLLAFYGVASAAYANQSVVTINDPAISSGYGASYYASTASTSPETHIIGVYETRSDHSFAGTAYVHVTGSASVPVNLVLSSYEPTHWILDGAGLSFVQSVLVNSYYVSTASGIDSTRVLNQNLGAYAYAWPGASGGSNTPALVAAVETQYGSPISTFSGVYRATDFSVALAPVPEPSAAVMLLCGLGIALVWRRKFPLAPRVA